LDNANVLAVAPPPRFALVPNAIAFRDPQHGIMGTGWQACAGQSGAFGCRPQGTISVTTDGGTTWAVLLRTQRPVVAVTIQGTSEQARFDDGETIGSSDGGRHWAPVVTGAGVVTGPCPPGSLAYVVPGWAACGWGESAGDETKSVYRLRASGWKRLAGSGISSYGYVQGIAMANDGFGVIWESRGTLYVTRDGGRDWTGLPKVAQPEVDFGVTAIALPHGVAFALLANGGGEKRRLIETTDAGRSWRVVHTWS
jgi:photosystem II stability/assembly factor-like uncharacterized protein